MLTVAVVVGTALFAYTHRHRPLAIQPARADILPVVIAKGMPATPQHPYHLAMNGQVFAEDLTAEQRAELDRRFREKFLPALNKWASAYKGRIPFELNDVKPDEFHNRDYNMYTYMVGSTTLEFKDAGESANVAYMMTLGGARDMNSIPTDGRPPDLSVPVSREEVLSMVKADRGVSYKPDQVQIKPTGAACSLRGGAFVAVNQQIVNGGELMTGKSFSLVFGSDGKLVNYEGPIFP